MNGYIPEWAQFFTERRLSPQIELAIHNGSWPKERARLAERFLARIPGLLAGVSHTPSLIHGDLWIGNVQISSSGLALIDPAISFSHREAEIAYTSLFGGFSSRFFSAYQAAWPLEPGFAERRDLYNVYHLLNHLNMFGESYGFQVDAIFRRYAG